MTVGMNPTIRVYQTKQAVSNCHRVATETTATGGTASKLSCCCCWCRCLASLFTLSYLVVQEATAASSSTVVLGRILSSLSLVAHRRAGDLCRFLDHSLQQHRMVVCPSRLQSLRPQTYRRTARFVAGCL